jgi:serine/threonine protein kinase
MSPELLDPDRFDLKDSQPTKESDSYSLGMVIYEVLSGKTPFAQWNEWIVMRKVIEGERPVKPEGAEGARFAGNLWETLIQWQHNQETALALRLYLSV